MIFQGVSQWPEETRRSRYPFVETASLRDVSGVVTLEDAVVLECRCWAAVANFSRAYISSVVREATKLTITVSNLEQELGQAVVRDMTKARIALRDVSGAQVGFIRVAPGGMARLHDNPSGIYRFAVGATELVASALCSRPKTGASSFVVGGEEFSGDVRLVGGEGTRLRYEGGVIYIDNIGNPYFTRDNCRDAQQLGLAINPVRKIVVSDTYQTYAVIPISGQVGVQITSAADRGLEQRSLVSPGPNGEVIATLLPA
jgi:hypothetical protein